METEITCPYCWERITIFLEPEPEEQSYVEDCWVCCRPIEISLKMKESEPEWIRIGKIEGIG